MLGALLGKRHPHKGGNEEVGGKTKGGGGKGGGGKGGGGKGGGKGGSGGRSIGSTGTAEALAETRRHGGRGRTSRPLNTDAAAAGSLGRSCWVRVAGVNLALRYATEGMSPRQRCAYRYG